MRVPAHTRTKKYHATVLSDNLTEREAADLQAQVIKDKARIAPKARGTAAKGDARELPGRIKEALQLPGGDNGTKKK